MCELDSHILSLLAKFDNDVKIVNDNARIPMKKKHHRRTSSEPLPLPSLQERRWDSMVLPTEHKDKSLSLAPLPTRTRDTVPPIPQRTTDNKLTSQDIRPKMDWTMNRTLPQALRSLPYSSDHSRADELSILSQAVSN